MANSSAPAEVLAKKIGPAMEVDYLTSLPRRIHLIVDEGAKAGASRPALTDERGIIWSYRGLIDTIEAVAGDLERLAALIRDDVVLGEDQSLAAAGV